MDVIKPFTNNLPIKHNEQNDNFKPYILLNDFFNKDEVNKVRQLWNETNWMAGQIGNNKLNQEIRKSKVTYISDVDHGWIYDKITMACMLTNASVYKFDILGFHGKLQVSKYESGDFYGWHMDSGKEKNSQRKLSISIQLSGPEEYEGGELQFLKGGHPLDMPKAQGTAIIFPSYIYHRVQPVISGSRMSIVGWIAGPPYR